MKNLVFFSSLLVAVICALTSCSKNDDTPTPGQVSVPFSIQYGIVAGAGSTTTVSSTPNSTVNLSDILTPSGNQDKAKYVSGSVISNSSSIVISGITGTGATLSNITFTADNDNTIKNVVLNDYFSKQPLVLTRDTTLLATDTNYSNFLTLVGTSLATKKSISLKATYTVSNSSITTGKITLNVSTTFGW